MEKLINNQYEIGSQNSNIYRKKKLLNKKSSNNSLVDRNNISNISN